MFKELLEEFDKDLACTHQIMFKVNIHKTKKQHYKEVLDKNSGGVFD